MTTPGLSRRTALTSAAGLGLALPVLAACSTSDAKNAAKGAATKGASAARDAAAALGTAADIPVNGGKVFADQKVVVTQPDKGDFKAFTAVCTHQGCIVSSVAKDVIHCGCHGSAFSATDGTVINGPATQPLKEVRVTVDGSGIHLA